MRKIKELVVKANELIEMPVDFSLMQLKLFAKIIVSIRDEPNKEFYEFSVKSLLQDFGLTETNYTQLKIATKGLIRPVVVKGEGIEEDQIPFFSRVNYTAKGIVKFWMSSELKPLILDLEKNYTKYYFSNIARLKSAYAIRIYELLKQYEFKGERVLSINEIKGFLKIEDDKYKQYGHFKSKVILVAQKELKSKTDIYFEVEEIKDKKKVFNIRFVIFNNTENKKAIEKGTVDYLPSQKNAMQKDELSNISKLEELEIFKNLVNEYKISKNIALKIIENFSEEKIRRNIEYTKREHKNGNVSKNFAGYLVEAIKNDYANNTVSLFEVDSKKKEEQARREKQLEVKREGLRSKLSLEFGRVEKENFLNSLSDTQKEDLKNQILEEIKLDSYSVGLLKKKGLNSPVAGMWIIKKIADFEERRNNYIEERLKGAGI